MYKPRFCSKHTQKLSPDLQSAFYLGLYTSGAVTLLGVLYFCLVLFLLISGQMVFPPSEFVQTVGGIITILAALLLLVFFVAIHSLMPICKKVFSLLGVVFCALFSMSVSINRFVQLSIVRLSILEGNAVGLERFLPYDGRSAMFALEMLGWGGFLSIALAFFAFIFDGAGISRLIRVAFLTYSILGLISAIAFVVDSPLSVIGFVAWGVILFIGTGLVTVSLLNYDHNWVAF